MIIQPKNKKEISPPSKTEAFQAAPKRRRSFSEYKKSLLEKQELRALYGLSEKKCKSYVKESLAKIAKVQNLSDELVKRLEKRLDNVVFRLGLAKSRAQARQMVSHAYFSVNGKAVNIPSFQVEKGDIVSLKESKKKKLVFKELPENIKKTKFPVWLEFDKETLQAKIVGEPTLAEVNVPVELSLIFEFYSR